MNLDSPLRKALGIQLILALCILVQCLLYYSRYAGYVHEVMGIRGFLILASAPANLAVCSAFMRQCPSPLSRSQSIIIVVFVVVSLVVLFKISDFFLHAAPSF